MSGELTTALEEQRDKPAMRSTLELLERQRPELEKVLPTGVTVDRFERIVRTELRRTPLLAECDAQSFLGAVMLCAQLGLEPGPLGHVYLVPFKRRVEFVVGYRGYIELAYRSGLVRDVYAELVRDGDFFRAPRGTSPKIEHEVLDPPEGREVERAYAVAHLKGGGTVSRVLWPEEWERARASSAAARKKSGPWIEHPEAMILKTAVRRLEPYLPKTRELAVAVEHDELEAPELEDVVEE